MPIDVYPSLLPGRPIETHAVSGMTLGDWLRSHGIDYESVDTQPIVVSFNRVSLPVDAWAGTHIGPADRVEIRVLPHGGLFKALGSILGKVFKLAFGWLTPSAKASSYRSPTDGSRLETSQATANRARLGDVVPELAGRFRRYPDYLTPPRRFFVNKREQWLEFLCCVGPGEYLIYPDDVRIGSTTFGALGDDAKYYFISPGADVSWHPAHRHWYSAPEVGGTSSGTAGLELTAQYTSAIVPAFSSATFNGWEILAPSASTWPESWSTGTVITAKAFMPYTVRLYEEFEQPSRNRIYGDFREFDPNEGDTIQLDLPGWGSPNVRIGEMGTDEFGAYLSVTDTNTEAPQWYANIPLGEQHIAFYVPGRRYLVTEVTDGSTRIVVNAIDTDVDTVPGWVGWPAAFVPAAFTVDDETVYGDWTNTFLAVPNLSETTPYIELDFFFTGGLGYIENDGDVSQRSVTVEIQWRDARVGGPFSSHRAVFTDATLDQIGFTERIGVGGITPEVRVRRIGSKDTSTQLNDTVQWYGLKSELQARTAYPNWTTMAVTIRSGGKLGAQSENQINVIATRVLPTLQGDGSWSAPQPTRDIAAFARYVASTIGYTDANLDMAEFVRLQSVWSARGETLDYVFDEGTVRDALNTAFGAGMAELVVEGGLIRPVRDDVRTVFEQSYSPQNMVSPLIRSFRPRRIDDFDGVEVEYTDGSTWSQETIKCFLPGDQGAKMDKLTIRGVTDRTRAWRIGMRRRRALRYRNKDYSFSTELDALNSRYLSYVPLIGDDPGYGQSAILTAIQASNGQALLTLSEPMVWEPAATHVIGYRKPDGTLAGPFLAQPGPDEYSVIAAIPQPWPVISLKQEPPHVYFGTVERWSFPALITEIRPNGIETVSVSAVNYDARVYADDNNAPA